MSRPTVVIELAADPRFARDLAAGGVFVPGCALRLADECDLVVCGVSLQLVVPARVVYVDASRGAGLELVGFSLEMKALLAELEPPARPSLELFDEPARDDDLDLPELPGRDDGDDARLAALTEPVPLVALEPLDDELELPVADDELELPCHHDGSYDPSAATDAYPVAGGDAGYRDIYADDIEGDGAAHGHGHDDSDGELADPDAITQPDGQAGARSQRMSSRPTQPLARNVHERLRGLSPAAQRKLASSGELHERVMLERLYGKNVWDTLLHNPRLTPPEVSRIARYGTLPRVLLDVIVANNTWLQVPEVRRALLSNPRLATDQIMKVLRLTPRHELKLAAIQTAYPAAVRQAARMLLRSG